ncbi:MAG: hypothetical protein ACT4QC_14125 [Planctomycetaceae bacterium]
MSEQATKRRGPIGWLKARSWGFWIVAVIIAYPLSRPPAGVVWYLLGQPQWFSQAANVFYYPLGVLNHVTFFWKAIGWYADLLWRLIDP